MTSVPKFPPRVFPNSGFDTVEFLNRIEEENLPNYLAQRYYPGRIGEVLNSRYQVITKLGFGSSSTVWLCRDLQDNCYLTLKIHVRSRQPLPEVEISRYLRALPDVHGGEKCVRLVLDSFQISGPYGIHNCLLYSPTGVDMSDFIHYLPDGALPENLLRSAIRIVLVALDYLHKAKVIHTDIQPNNILLGIDDESVLVNVEEDEITHPVPRKQLNDRIIYVSRSMPLTGGEPVLSDLGEARLGERRQSGLIMPSVYRAPEVMLGMTRHAWTLFEKGHLFENGSLENDADHAYRFAEMISLLGPPPLEFLKRRETSLKFWDESGNWKDSAAIPDQSLESRESRLRDNDKKLFLQFIKKTLYWLPEERPTALELLHDEWVRGEDY